MYGGPAGQCQNSAGESAACTSLPGTCEANVVTGQENWNSVEVIEVDTIAGTETSQGYDCVGPTAIMEARTQGQVEEPVQIVVTRDEFAALPVEPLVATAGPPEGWIPVNMVNVLYAEPEEQVLDTELLGTPVQVRATPISYHWDLGDGNTITTSEPGEPYPSEAVSSEYRYEGWYDVTLTTTFEGKYSVDGGPWEPIDGTIEVASDPIEIFAKSFESRLVNPDVPVDEEEDPYVPDRSPDTEGPQDPEARHREL